VFAVSDFLVYNLLGVYSVLIDPSIRIIDPPTMYLHFYTNSVPAPTLVPIAIGTGIFIRPTESPTAREQMFKILYQREVKHIDFVVADGLKHLEDALAEIYPETTLQKYVTDPMNKTA